LLPLELTTILFIRIELIEIGIFPLSTVVVFNFTSLTKPGGDFLNNKQTQESWHVWSESNT
jgi:hypothetical protein